MYDIEEQIKKQEIEDIFKGMVPKDLREKKADQKEKNQVEEKKEPEKKPVDNSGSVLNKALVEDKKDESGTNIYSEISDDDTRKDQQGDVKKAKKTFTESELDQKIFITLTETPTTFFYFSPSTTLITNPKNRKLLFILI